MHTAPNQPQTNNRCTKERATFANEYYEYLFCLFRKKYIRQPRENDLQFGDKPAKNVHVQCVCDQYKFGVPQNKAILISNVRWYTFVTDIPIEFKRTTSIYCPLSLSLSFSFSSPPKVTIECALKHLFSVFFCSVYSSSVGQPRWIIFIEEADRGAERD